VTTPRAATTIAIDGPVASGKTAVGRRVAAALGFHFLDTGLLYRAVAWAAIQRGISPDDESALTALASGLRIEVTEPNQGERVLVDGDDATDALKDKAIEGIVSRTSRVAGVRQALVATQRDLADLGRVVMAGRDIGTVILPEADVKLFLQASVAERARRRRLELVAAGGQASLDQVQREIEARDLADTQRAASPLRPADDAHLMDTDGVSLDEVVERVLALVKADA
jgi:cytidylate kinase